MKLDFVEYLFPTPVAGYMLDVDFSDEELTFIHGQERKKNYLNQVSINKYVLNDSKMSRIKEKLIESCNSFASQVWRVKNPSLFITQSWVNWTLPGECHHEHTHKNSLYSAVLYIDVTPQDTIYFIKPVKIELEPEYEEFVPCNAHMSTFFVKKNQLLIFPSWLKHGVNTVVGADRTERISLSFNIFSTKLGSCEESTELIFQL